MSRSDEIALQTRIRHKLLENGYTPLANKAKDCLLTGWSNLVVDSDMVESWADKLKYRATGVRIGGGLMMIDFDIDDADMVAAIMDALPDDLWKKLKACPVRFGSGAKEAWFARLPDGAPEFYRIASGAYVKKGCDPEAEDVVLHRLEVFAAGGRQAGAYGAHTVDKETGDVSVSYRWLDDRGLVEVPFDALPVVSEADVVRLCQIVNEVLEAGGWVPNTRAAAGKTVETEVYDLDDGMEFETRDYGVVGLKDLEDLCADGQVRLSASWLEGHAARNLTRCIATLHPSDGRVRILETASFSMHRPKELDGRARFIRLGERMAAVGYIAEDGGLGEKVDTSSYRDNWAEVDEDDKPRIFVKVGDMAIAARVTARAMAAHDRFYDYGGKPAVVAPWGSRVEIMDEHRMANELGYAFRFLRPAKPAEEGEEQKEPTPIDPPMALIKQVISLGESRGLRPLVGVVDMPIMRLDGTAVDSAGYDPTTRLLVQANVRGVIPDNPTDAEVDAALEKLWSPFRMFPFVDSRARGGMLAAVLTAVLRRVLPTAPAFAFDAPTQGSGKTLLAQTVGALAGGAKIMSPLPPRNEEEVAKTLLSVLIQSPRAVVFDNQIGVVDSASLAAVLTSPVFEGRVLGSTSTVSSPTNCLVMLTGNNITLGGDMPRRTVTVRIDAEMETPFARAFTFNPLEIVQADRFGLTVAALTLVRAAFGASVAGRIGSFEAWDRMVAQTVRWLDDDRFADPLDLILEAHASDPVRDETHDLLEGIKSIFGETYFTARDLIDKINSHAAGVGPMRDALNGMVTSLNSRSVGRALKFRVGQRVKGLVLTCPQNAGTHGHTIRYRVISESGAGSGSVVTEFRK